MRVKVRKFFVDIEKEEEWLNLMEANGWHFEDYFLGNYTFSEGTADQYLYHVKLHVPFTKPTAHDMPAHQQYPSVRLQSSGWSRQFYRGLTDEGGFDVYHSLAARRDHYKQYVRLLGIGSSLFVLLLLFNLFLGSAVAGYAHTSWYVTGMLGIILIMTLYIVVIYLRKMFRIQKQINHA